MADAFANLSGGLDSPATKAFAIVTDNATLLTNATRCVYVGVTGDVTALLVGDTASVLFKGVPAGTFMPIRAQRIDATGTTATNLVGIY
jgi:hypothetical protein